MELSRKMSSNLRELNINCVCFGKQSQTLFDIANIKHLACDKIELQCSRNNDYSQLTYSFNECAVCGHSTLFGGGVFPPQYMQYDDFKNMVTELIYQKMDIDSVSYITATNLYVCKSNCYSGKISEDECRLLLDTVNYCKNDI